MSEHHNRQQPAQVYSCRHCHRVLSQPDGTVRQCDCPKSKRWDDPLIVVAGMPFRFSHVVLDNLYPPNPDAGAPVVEILADGRARITGINRTWFADLAPHPLVELGARVGSLPYNVLAIEWDGDALLTDAPLHPVEHGAPSIQFAEVDYEPVSSYVHLSRYPLSLPEAIVFSERLRAGERLVAVLIDSEFWRIQPEPVWLPTNGLARYRKRG